VDDFRGNFASNLGGFIVLLWVAGVGCLIGLAAPDQNPAPTREEVTAIAQKRLKEARDVLKTAPDSTEAKWHLGRALFDAIAFTPEGKLADQLIKEAITVCRETIAKDSKLPAAHYYLALNLGHLARTKSLGALKLVEEMEKELKITLSLDEKFDHAGADRTLGCLYRDTPGWPVSVGSKTKAHLHLQRAVEFAPDYPGNRLALAEAQMKWGEKKALVANVTALREVWPRARSMFEGEKWAGDWLEWNQSWAQALSVAGGEKTKP
jgi:hypothetical protein